MAAPVIHRLDLADGIGSIVLYDWMAEEVDDGCNLARLDGHGSTVWRASSPIDARHDCFVGVRWEGGALIAHTFSCYRVRVDPESGAVTMLEATK